MLVKADNSAKALTPRRVVEELDRYIIGQKEAKCAVAVAIRNRWRRQQLPEELRDEIAPKNIILIGPTGVGKTELARRLAGLVRAPFLKVEATKYTEVGYHGRDVESMIRQLVESSVNMVRSEALREVQPKAEAQAEERLLEVLLPRRAAAGSASRGRAAQAPASTEDDGQQTREKLRKKLRAGELDSRSVEINVEERRMPMMQVISNAGFEEYGLDMQNMFGSLFPGKRVARRLTIPEARRVLTQQEAEKLLDQDHIARQGVERAEYTGIIFLDELDKIVAREHAHGPDVSREGVQRDLLPVVEGSTVVTRYGPVNTDHVLFIAAGAFHNARPSDLIPELQGRFPIRVELSSLGRDDFVRILTEPRNALIRQYQELLRTEGIELQFAKDAVETLAEIAAQVNESAQDIGARRLYTILEKVVEQISFEAPDTRRTHLVIDAEYIRRQLEDTLKDEDLSRYIL